MGCVQKHVVLAESVHELDTGRGRARGRADAWALAWADENDDKKGVVICSQLWLAPWHKLSRR